MTEAARKGGFLQVMDYNTADSAWSAPAFTLLAGFVTQLGLQAPLLGVKRFLRIQGKNPECSTGKKYEKQCYRFHPWSPFSSILVAFFGSITRNNELPGGYSTLANITIEAVTLHFIPITFFVLN
ncbi:hypothetical protein [Modicisalibacter xianhensis]|uniref:hypothetical protein n=1 Tax=Modicisalibacter xianhensis TaxID=442341 RepID=UPI00116040EC|nr:hypothetical protein [Halomonas xianhensis]